MEDSSHSVPLSSSKAGSCCQRVFPASQRSFPISRAPTLRSRLSCKAGGEIQGVPSGAQAWGPTPASPAPSPASGKWGDVPRTRRQGLKAKGQGQEEAPAAPGDLPGHLGRPGLGPHRRSDGGGPGSRHLQGWCPPPGAAEPPDPAATPQPAAAACLGQLPDPRQPSPRAHHASSRRAAGLAMPAPSRDAGWGPGRALTGGAGGGSAGRGESSPERHGRLARPAAPRPRSAAPPAGLRGPAPLRLG